MPTRPPPKRPKRQDDGAAARLPELVEIEIPPPAVEERHAHAVAGRPVRCRMRPLQHWRNEHVVYKHPQGASFGPTVAAVVVALAPQPAPSAPATLALVARAANGSAMPVPPAAAPPKKKEKKEKKEKKNGGPGRAREGPTTMTRTKRPAGTPRVQAAAEPVQEVVPGPSQTPRSARAKALAPGQLVPAEAMGCQSVIRACASTPAAGLDDEEVPHKLAGRCHRPRVADKLVTTRGTKRGSDNGKQCDETKPASTSVGKAMKTARKRTAASRPPKPLAVGVPAALEDKQNTTPKPKTIGALTTMRSSKKPKLAQAPSEPLPLADGILPASARAPAAAPVVVVTPATAASCEGTPLARSRSSKAEKASSKSTNKTLALVAAFPPLPSQPALCLPRARRMLPRDLFGSPRAALPPPASCSSPSSSSPAPPCAPPPSRRGGGSPRVWPTFESTRTIRKVSPATGRTEALSPGDGAIRNSAAAHRCNAAEEVDSRVLVGRAECRGPKKAPRRTPPAGAGGTKIPSPIMHGPPSEATIVESEIPRPSCHITHQSSSHSAGLSLMAAIEEARLRQQARPFRRQPQPEQLDRSSVSAAAASQSRTRRRPSRDGG